jgi:hypothetical protein
MTDDRVCSVCGSADTIGEFGCWTDKPDHPDHEPLACFCWPCLLAKRPGFAETMRGRFKVHLRMVK